MNTDVLIGKTVKSVYVDEGQLTIETVESGFYTMPVYGDCCSHSYIHEVIGAERLIDKRIATITEIDLHPSEVVDHGGNKSDYTDTKVYGVRFSAVPSDTEIKPGIVLETSNSMLVEYRNDSNGYYGGSFDGPNKTDAPTGQQVLNSWHRL